MHVGVDNSRHNHEITHVEKILSIGSASPFTDFSDLAVLKMNGRGSNTRWRYDPIASNDMARHHEDDSAVPCAA
jgi:hypothetical protein